MSSLAKRSIPFFLACVLALPAHADDARDRTIDLDAKIARLIDNLGARQFATREKAHADLERLGLVAFDALHDAQNHDNIEIALRARHLVRSMQVTWWRVADPREVKHLLRDYGKQLDHERETRMGRLARLDQAAGLEALCRLVRFETKDRLSKNAALLVMNEIKPADADDARALAGRLNAAIGASRRPAADWLRLYARTVVDPLAMMDEWDVLIRAEQQTYANFPESSSRQVTLALMRWQAKTLLDMDEKKRAADVSRRTLSLVDGSQDELFDSIDWLIAHRQWQVIDELVGRYPQTFNEVALLIYRRAESHLGRGEPDKAETLAEHAHETMGDSAEKHNEAGLVLQERGLFDWSEREFRAVIASEPVASEHSVRATKQLSEMLHDQGQDLAAATVRKVLIDAIDSDEEVLREITQSREPLDSLRGRMHYYFATHYSETGDRVKQQEHLEKGVEAHPTDADILIAMYRLPNPSPAWRAKTMAAIDQAAEGFRLQIAEYKRQSEESPQQSYRQTYLRFHAMYNNQFAWLISNTAGDYDEALRCSLLSLELLPETAAYLDTLGRCYYARGDLKMAVKAQREAVRHEPHSGLIRKQLDQFEKEWAAAQSRRS